MNSVVFLQPVLHIYASSINLFMYNPVFKSATKITVFFLVKLFVKGGYILTLSFDEGEAKDCKIHHTGCGKIIGLIKSCMLIGTIPSLRDYIKFSS